jgi:hypothetical protein
MPGARERVEWCVGWLPPKAVRCYTDIWISGPPLMASERRTPLRPCLDLLVWRWYVLRMTNLDSDTTLALLRLALSGDKVMVAFDLDGVTHKLPNPMSPEEAKYALTCALGLGATRTSISRFEA